MADIVDRATRSRIMSGIRGRDTKPEVIVRKQLYAQGFRYRIAPKNLPGKPDIVLPKYRTAVFVHGCFWHGHSRCRYFVQPKTRSAFWLKKIAANRTRDEYVCKELLADGWKVAIVWECVTKDEKTVSSLAAQLGSFIRGNDDQRHVTTRSKKVPFKEFGKQPY